MKTFIVYARVARTDKNFNLSDLPGAGGKMDTVCRFVANSLWTSHSMRRDVMVYTVLNGPSDPPVTLEFSGEKMKRVNPDERSIASWILKGLELIGNIEKTDDKPWFYVQEGIRVSRKSFQEIVKAHKDRPMYVLEEKGENIEDVDFGENPVFVIGDHIGLGRCEEKFVLRYGDKISLGKQLYFASACVSIIHYILDKRLNS